MQKSFGWLTVLCAVVALGCGNDKSCKTGNEGCDCYGNKTCNSGLACKSDLCVDLGDSGAAGSSGSGGKGGKDDGGAGRSGGAGGIATGGTGGAAACVLGAVGGCACPSGWQGTQTCQPNGTWTACSCTGMPTGGVGGISGSGGYVAGSGGMATGGTCVINATKSCPCFDGTTGVQICLDGKSYSECQCGSAGTGGTGGAAACPGPFTSICGVTACADLSAAATAASAKYNGMACVMSCCTADQKCGSQLQPAGFGALLITGTTCMPMNQPGATNSACNPNLNPPGTDGGITIPGGIGVMFTMLQEGCCTTAGKCGVLLTDLDMGCVANEDLGKVSSIYSGMIVPKMCTP